MDLREALKYYPHIPGEIARITKEIRDTMAMKKDTQDTLKAQTMSDMPRGAGVSDPTLRAVVRSIDRHDLHIQYLARRIAELYDLKEHLENLLQGLTVQEAQVIEEYFFKGYRMVIVQTHLGYAKSQTYRLCESALDKMETAERKEARV